MAYDPGAIDQALSAAVGDDPALIAELRAAFIDGVRAALDTIERAGGTDEWRDGLLKLRGLAASFGAVRCGWRNWPEEQSRCRSAMHARCGRCGATSNDCSTYSRVAGAKLSP